MLAKYLDNLKIRSKLILFLIIPVLTILYFSISGIYFKFQEQQKGKKSLEFILVSFQIDDAIHELQKERGISAGFAGSGGKLLREELRAQRQRMDEKLQLLGLKLLASAQKKDYSDFPDVFARVKLNRKKLNIIRNNVDSKKQTDFFESYSDLIDSGLDIIRTLQVVTSDAIIARQSDAYTNLLLLQERSGQERGLLNGVFTSGLLGAKQFKLFSGYVADQEALLKKFYTVASKNQQDLLSEKMKSRNIAEVEKLRTAAIHKASRNDKLNSLQGFIGYGGLIHNFKNYVIRGSQSDLNTFNAIYMDAIKIIEEYQELPGMSEKEIHSLKIIKTTFYKYKSLLENIRRLRKKGRSVSEIDSMVKVDDKPALQAINYLHKTVTGLDTSKWWDKASIRIELIREVSNSVRTDILALARQNLASATRSLYLYLILTISSLMISFILGYRIIFRLVGSIISIESHLRKMQMQRKFDNSIVISGNDEISKVAESFNNLINERSKYEEQMRLAAMVFEQASEAMMVTDADNHFIAVNPAFTKITGYTLGEVIGFTPAILQSGKQNKKFYMGMWEILQQQGCWSGEILNRRKNGDIYPEWLNINIIKNDEGKTIKYIAMFSDITERKNNEKKQENLQRQLMQAQKMESLGQLTGGLAHDFNNMLSAIIGYTDLAIESDKNTDKIDKYLNEVILAGNRAKDLVAQMLAFSRGSKDIERELLDIKPLLQESIKMIRPLLPSTIEFVTHFTSGVTTIVANPVMLHQVIMNLCINARDAISEHGQIDFSMQLLTINNEVCNSCHMPVNGNYLELSIQDTGGGIEPKIINNLFDPFFTTKEMGNEKGTGMGLAMVHGIMHKHNGHIIVESTVGKGTKFRLLFPLTIIVDNDETIKTNNVSLPLTANKIDGLNILIVDDEKSIVSLMQEMLTGHGFKVTGFTDSELALSHFKENTKEYDLVITDQTMPNLTGAELSKAILEIQPDIPVILCTGYSERINEKYAQNIGIRAYMNKPVKMKDLLDKITDLVG